jgi:very-short-patch-repair endonuclease
MRRSRYDEESISFRRGLRRESSDAEQRVWRMLRARKLDGVKFRRQHPIGRYVLDFYCPAARLAIEIDGGSHYEPRGIRRDLERTAFLKSIGIRVIRFTNLEALGECDGLLEAVWDEVRAAGISPPHPDPLPPRAAGGSDG